MKSIVKASELEKILENIFNENQNKRIVVIGTTCSGKSTIVKKLAYARDMDKEIFPLLSKEEIDYVCQEPWTREIGEKMNQFVRERINTIQGKPLFGTVCVDADLVVFLKLDKYLLEERCDLRNVNIINAVNMQDTIENDVSQSNIEYLTLNIYDDSKFQIYTCGIIEESLNNTEILDNISSYLIRKRVVDMPMEKDKVWHIDEFRMPFFRVQQIIMILTREIKKEWYIHIFSKDDNVLFVILKDKYFKVSAIKDESWNEMIEYGLLVGVDRKWTENISLSV